MIVPWKPYNEKECVKLGTYNFEIVKGCTCIGTLLIDKNGLRPEAERKNCECKWSILCTFSPTKEPIRTRSKKIKNL
jgi:hypothetical protein